MACYNFAGRNKVAGACGACARRELLKTGYCRLCWVQAALERPTGPCTPLAPYLRKVTHQQLFLADLNRRRAAPRTSPRRYGAKGRPLKAPPPAAVRPRVDRFQLPLLIVPRHYSYGRVDLRSGPAPENPWLEWALHLAHTIAESRGFDPMVRRALNRTLIMLLAEHREGELIRSSDFHHVLLKSGTCVEHTSEILQMMGVLLDDLPGTFEKWLQRTLDGLTPGIRSETGRWVRTLHDGGPRSRPRSPDTARIYLRVLKPALLEWSASYEHLRQVTREDIFVHAERLYGQERQLTMAAFRSLFVWARKNDVVFRNPAHRIKAGRLDRPVWQPLHPEEIARTIEAATTPQARLLVALAAVHAARHGAVRAMQLDNVDFPNRRLTIAGRERPLDELTHRLLLQWLDYRRRRWPNTANQHLLISAHTALRHGPVSAPWGNLILRGLPATIERLRIDRQLEEALTHRADPLHLAVVFDIHESTAIRYAASARQLLEEPHETRSLTTPRTRVSTGDNEPPEHSGSR